MIYLSFVEGYLKLTKNIHLYCSNLPEIVKTKLIQMRILEQNTKLTPSHIAYDLPASI